MLLFMFFLFPYKLIFLCEVGFRLRVAHYKPTKNVCGIVVILEMDLGKPGRLPVIQKWESFYLIPSPRVAVRHVFLPLTLLYTNWILELFMIYDSMRSMG